MQRMTNAGYFANNIITNCGNFFSPSCSQFNPPQYVISGNTITVSNNSGGAFNIAAIQNLTVSNNTIVDLGSDSLLQFQPLSAFLNQSPVSGVQSSNILFSGNTFSNFQNYLVFLGGSGPTSTDSVTTVSLTGNIMQGNHSAYLEENFGWHTNVIISGNDFSSFNGITNYGNNVAILPGSSSQYSLVDTNNLYYSFLIDSGTNENVSYGQGSRFVSINSASTATYTLVNSDATNVPLNAKVILFNQNTNTVTMYLNSTNGQSVSVPTNSDIVAYFFNGSWYTNGPGSVLYVGALNIQQLTTH